LRLNIRLLIPFSINPERTVENAGSTALELVHKLFFGIEADPTELRSGWSLPGVLDHLPPGGSRLGTVFRHFRLSEAEGTPLDGVWGHRRLQ